MVKEGKKNQIIVISLFILLILILTVSTGFFDEVKKIISGRATEQVVELNITVGGPQIVEVFNESIEDVSSGPTENSMTTITVNFSVYIPSGAGNLNESTSLVNISFGSETPRENSSCVSYESGGNYANYSCNITMWWFDGTGNWNITAYIQDNQTNTALNTTTSFYVGERTAFVMGPAILNWPGIASGATNRTSNNDPLLLNNTGNDPIAATSIEINSSNLRGETDSTIALWAGNFSSSWNTGGACSGAACVECAGTAMINGSLVGLATANLTKGNYTENDGNTGQEELYFCVRQAGTELSTQAYSTANETEWNWIVKIS